MNKRTIGALAATAAACAIGAAPQAALADTNQATSANWSGYVATAASGSQFKSVSATWVEPTANCSNGQSFGAFWVGLGGGGSAQALEQAGTEANCDSNGNAEYYAWYELVPKAPVQVNLPVNPGDRVYTRVTVSGHTIGVSITNQTTGSTYSKTLQMSNTPDVSTAEWIAEAPSACDQSVSNCNPLALTDFGSIKFIGAHATTADGHTGTISDSNWSATAVSLGSDGTTLGATPGSLSSDGSSFDVGTSTSAGSTSVDTSGNGNGYSYGGGDGYGGGYGYSDGGGYGYSDGSGYGGGYGYSDGGGYGGGDGYSDGGGYTYVPGPYGFDGSYGFDPSGFFGS